MATSTTGTLANQYQKHFTTELLQHAVQLTVLDQFANKQKMPKKRGTKIISFFRRTKSVLGANGLVQNVQILSEGTPISTFADATLDRIDVSLIQYGEASKVTDILSMTELFDALNQNKELMAEDCALNADSIVRNALVAATNAGVTLNQAGGTVVEKIGQVYAQGLANYAALNSASQSGGKAVATDFLRAVTKLKINRAPTFGGNYIAVIPPQVSADLQNDPDWIDAANYGDPNRRFRGELKTIYGCKFIEHTNPFQEDTTGAEHTYSVAAAPLNRAFRTWIFGRGAYGTPAIEGSSPFNPQIIIVNTPDKTDPLNQYMTAGWKAFWGASALNCPYALSLTTKSEFAD